MPQKVQKRGLYPLRVEVVVEGRFEGNSELTPANWGRGFRTEGTAGVQALRPERQKGASVAQVQVLKIGREDQRGGETGEACDRAACHHQTQ